MEKRGLGPVLVISALCCGAANPGFFETEVAEKIWEWACL